MLLLVGLGNPGGAYAKHRHNVGFTAVETVARAHGFSPWKKQFRSEVSEGAFDTPRGRIKVLALKPQTFMNESGRAVLDAAQFYKIDLADIVVMHDELDLAAGKIRMKTGGGDAGHNGLRSITEALGPDYRRLRIGVGHPGDKTRVTGHVLGAFSKDDAEWLYPLLNAIAEAAPLLATRDDAGFTTRVALLREPEKPKKAPPAKTQPPEKD